MKRRHVIVTIAVLNDSASPPPEPECVAPPGRIRTYDPLVNTSAGAPRKRSQHAASRRLPFNRRVGKNVWARARAHPWPDRAPNSPLGSLLIDLGRPNTRRHGWLKDRTCNAYSFIKKSNSQDIHLAQELRVSSLSW